MKIRIYTLTIILEDNYANDTAESIREEIEFAIGDANGYKCKSIKLIENK